jgi:hypothetical protein
MRIKESSQQNNCKAINSMEWMLILNLKARRSCPCLQIQDLHWAFWWRTTATMVKNVGRNNEWAQESGWKRREERTTTFVLWSITVGLRQKPSIIAQYQCWFVARTCSIHRQFNVGSSHKPAVMWTLTTIFCGPQSFSDFKAKNRQWRFIITSSIETGTNGPGTECWMYSSGDH